MKVTNVVTNCPIELLQPKSATQQVLHSSYSDGPKNIHPFTVYYLSCVVFTREGVSFPATIDVELIAIALITAAIFFISSVSISSS